MSDPKNKPKNILKLVRQGFFLTDNITFVGAENVTIIKVENEFGKTKPMLILEKAVIMLIHQQKILDVAYKKNHGVWLELVRGP